MQNLFSAKTLRGQPLSEFEQESADPPAPRLRRAGSAEKKRQKDGGKKMKTGDFFAPIFLPAVFVLGSLGKGKGMIARSCLFPIPLPLIPLPHLLRNERLSGILLRRRQGATRQASNEEIQPRISRITRIREEAFPIRGKKSSLEWLILTRSSARRNGRISASNFHSSALFLACLFVFSVASWSARAQGKPEDAFLQTVTAKFFMWDSDHDQTLTLEELDAAILDPANTGRAAAALAALKRAVSSTNYTLPPLTLATIRQLANSPPATNRPDLKGLYRQSLMRVGGVTHRYIFTSGQLFATGLPKLEAIRQGRMGDCFCLAPLGAMVHRDPHEVASLFAVEPDGHVLVQFGGGTVRVAAPTDAEFALAMLAANTRESLWVNLYEKAISELSNLANSPEKQSGLAIEAIAKGGDGGVILSYLTGHKVSRFSFKFASDPAVSSATRDAKMAELRQKLAEASEQKLLMVCGTSETTTPGLTDHHAYALLNYHLTTDSVDLWNPHSNNFTPEGAPGLNHGYATKSGRFTVPLAEFVQQFHGVAFESTEFAGRQ